MKSFYMLCITMSLACSAQYSDNEGPVIELLDVDQAFSDLSEKEGIRVAFLEYASDEAVLLRPKLDPIIGKPAIETYLDGIEDDKFTLTWDPLQARVSKSKDMGYTFGTYTLTQDTLTLEGTYTSYWVKTDQGWKYSLDSGNPGLTP